MSSDGLGRYLLPFIILATLNAGGYRYGASDQAFYLPAVLAKLDPSLYPRDAALLAAQAKLTAYDEVVATIVRVTGASLPAVSAVSYVASLVLIAVGTWMVARFLFRTSWGAVALLAAMTLRHAIARSGTNTLEGYFQPRQIVFGLGLIAVGAFLRGRFAVAAVLVVAGGAIHPTAALWFAVWLAAAAVLLPGQLRRGLLAAALPLAVVAAWALTAGPLGGRLGVMDDEWLGMLAGKNYLFPLKWPAYAWILNIGYLLLIGVIYRKRRRAGLVDDRERALTLGCCALAGVFAVALILQAFKIVLAFQLQPARLFLMFDFLATVYVVWAAAEGMHPRLRRAQFVALAIIVFSVARGGYVVVEARRPLVQLTIPDDDWGQVMAWARTTDRRSAWLADPLHAALYGTSLRVAAERDVFVEGVKDAALGIYDREIARRTDQRMRLLKDFLDLSAEDALTIGAKYDLDYFVVEKTLDLPLAFESGALRVYRLR